MTFYSFNHQIRFNNKHEFNSSFGRNRSSYNSNIKKILIKFCDTLNNKNIEFLSLDFLEVKLDSLKNTDLVYCDPPYLTSTATYNDGKGGFKDWGIGEESKLLNLLDKLNSNKINFALSNMFYHKGLKNIELIKWSKKYNINYIDNDYSNCNYQFKEKDKFSIAVLITNF